MRCLRVAAYRHPWRDVMAEIEGLRDRLAGMPAEACAARAALAAAAVAGFIETAIDDGPGAGEVTVRFEASAALRAARDLARAAVAGMGVAA